jgi:hypothetical protein
MKNHALKSVVQISASPKKYCNLLTFKMVKLGTLFFATVDIQKQNFLLQQGYKKKTQLKLLSYKSNKNKTEKSKYYWVASHKALSL